VNHSGLGFRLRSYRVDISGTILKELVVAVENHERNLAGIDI
jgi:hypothetical protein